MNEPLLQAARVPVNLQAREGRRRLARMVLALFDRWGLSTAEQAALLGLSPDNRATIARYRRGQPFGESRDLIERAGHLLGIHKSLRILFPHDRELAFGWVKAPNRRLGARPLEIMIGRGFEGLLAVRRYLDFERGRQVLADLGTKLAPFADDLIRNIPGIRVSQALFDDLAQSAADEEVAIAAEALGRIPSPAPAITRPFDYGTVIAYSFDAANWQATRFSDGQRFGVWYGSPELETTIYETVFHAHRFIADSYPDLDRDVVRERRVFDVRCDALLVDLRGRETTHPDLVSRTSYSFTQALGRYLHEQGQNGLLVKSARCDGTNAAVFNAQRLSNVRDKRFLTYRINPARDRAVVERDVGMPWLTIAPSTLY